MKAWHIAAAFLGVAVIMVIVRNMQTQKVGTGATSNDVIVGLSSFGTGLLSLGGKIFTPSASGPSSGTTGGVSGTFEGPDINPSTGAYVPYKEGSYV